MLSACCWADGPRRRWCGPAQSGRAFPACLKPRRPPVSRALLQDAGLENEENELLIEREIQSNGKSRAFVGNRPATAALLKNLAPYLGDIHGQHGQQQLFSTAVQCEMLDAFAGADAF